MPNARDFLRTIRPPYFDAFFFSDAKAESLTRIGEYAFSGCLSLEEITIPANVTLIKRCAFWNDYSLSSATFENTNGWYTDYDKSKRADNQIFVFSYVDTYGNEDLFYPISNNWYITKLLTRWTECHYLGNARSDEYRTIDRFSYDWHRE